MYNGNGNSYGNGSYRRGGIPSTYLYIGAVAVVLPLETTPHSEHFAAMVREANRGRDFHVASTRAEAEAWLARD